MKSSLKVLIDKELREYFQSKRIYVIFILILLIGIIGTYSALDGFGGSTGSEGSTTLFLSIFSNTNGNLPSFASLLSFLLPLIGITLGFDSVNGERLRGTLSRLLAQPIYRDTIIIAKFIAGMEILTLMIVALFGMVSGMSILILGIPPTADELGRLIVYMLITVIFASIWFAFSLGMSVFFKQATVSALAGIALWIFATFFMNMLIQGIVDAVYPVKSTMDTMQLVKNQKLLINLLMCSPLSLYSNSISAILNPEVRSLGLVFYEQLEGAIAGKLPLSESIMVIFPYLLLMLGFIFVLFILAYMKFIRQEVRST